MVHSEALQKKASEFMGSDRSIFLCCITKSSFVEWDSPIKKRDPATKNFLFRLN